MHVCVELKIQDVTEQRVGSGRTGSDQDFRKLRRVGGRVENYRNLFLSAWKILKFMPMLKSSFLELF